MAKIEKTQKSQAKERAELEDDERDGRLFIQDLARLVLHASPRCSATPLLEQGQRRLEVSNNWGLCTSPTTQSRAMRAATG